VRKVLTEEEKLQKGRERNKKNTRGGRERTWFTGGIAEGQHQISSEFPTEGTGR
jgi:hypothetical protein